MRATKNCLSISDGDTPRTKTDPFWVPATLALLVIACLVLAGLVWYALLADLP